MYSSVAIQLIARFAKLHLVSTTLRALVFRLPHCFLVMFDIVCWINTFPSIVFYHQISNHLEMMTIVRVCVHLNDLDLVAKSNRNNLISTKSNVEQCLQVSKEFLIAKV